MDTTIKDGLVGKEFFYYRYDWVHKGTCVKVDGNYAIIESGIYTKNYAKIKISNLVPTAPDESHLWYDESTKLDWKWFFVGWFIGDIFMMLVGLL